jgi:hypothetical protein
MPNTAHALWRGGKSAGRGGICLGRSGAEGVREKEEKGGEGMNKHEKQHEHHHNRLHSTTPKIH